MRTGDGLGHTEVPARQRQTEVVGPANVPLCVSHRLQVSKASADLMNYCSEHSRNDPLLMGIPTSDNPFKDKKPCTIL